MPKTQTPKRLAGTAAALNASMQAALDKKSAKAAAKAAAAKLRRLVEEMHDAIRDRQAATPSRAWMPADWTVPVTKHCPDDPEGLLDAFGEENVMDDLTSMCADAQFCGEICVSEWLQCLFTVAAICASSLQRGSYTHLNLCQLRLAQQVLADVKFEHNSDDGNESEGGDGTDVDFSSDTEDALPAHPNYVNTQMRINARYARVERLVLAAYRAMNPAPAEQFDYSKLRRVDCGGCPLPDNWPELVKDAKKCLKSAPALGSSWSSAAQALGNRNMAALLLVLAVGVCRSPNLRGDGHSYIEYLAVARDMTSAMLFA